MDDVPGDIRYQGIDRLYGAGAVERLRRAHVAVVGIGGVGSWAAEALARSGIGRITLFDADEVCLSNTNRQLHALTSNVGRSKVQVMAERLAAIDPTTQVEALEQFVTPANLEASMTRGSDLVLDACDALRVQVEMIAFCRRRKIPIIVSGSAGGRTDPTLVRTRDLSKTEMDVLLALVRKRLRQDFGWPRGPKRFFGVQAVYSLENVRFVNAKGEVCAARPGDAEGSVKLDCSGGLGAAMHVTATFGMAMVGKGIEMLLRPATETRAPHWPS